jgi:hypothetical protein
MPPLMLPAAFAAFYFCRGAQFKKTERSAPPCAFAAFVELSPDEEAGATAAVKAAWQGDAGGIRRLRADLSVGELPEETPGPVLEMSLDALYIPKSEVPVELPPLPPSMRAADPRRIGPQPAAEEAAAPVFAKEELLKID